MLPGPSILTLAQSGSDAGWQAYMLYIYIISKISIKNDLHGKKKWHIFGKCKSNQMWSARQGKAQDNVNRKEGIMEHDSREDHLIPTGLGAMLRCKGGGVELTWRTASMETEGLNWNWANCLSDRNFRRNKIKFPANNADERKDRIARCESYQDGDNLVLRKNRPECWQHALHATRVRDTPAMLASWLWPFAAICDSQVKAWTYLRLVLGDPRVGPTGTVTPFVTLIECYLHCKLQHRVHVQINTK